MNIFPVKGSNKRFVQLQICLIRNLVTNMFNIFDLLAYSFLFFYIRSGKKLYKILRSFYQVFCILFKKRIEMSDPLGRRI